MTSTLRNTFLLGTALLAGVVAWVWAELSKSYELIAIASDPVLSAERGFIDAEDDFIHNRAKFMDVYSPGVGHVTTGILEEELQGKYAEFRPQEIFFLCGTGFHIEDYALDSEQHEHNKFYAQAYNAKLLEFISSSAQRYD
ncbi:hypothetical protein ACJJIL_10255 [Microbulbifer sp. EKSA005]|uniref:hypothetical protein n=1 Tax=Microbulbifer sp. EKSA005 TaxID=3243364 RepID=UPI0040425410